MNSTVEASEHTRLPLTPNYIQGATGRLIDIGTLTEAQLRIIGAEWTEALVKHAETRRKDAA